MDDPVVPSHVHRYRPLDARRRMDSTANTLCVTSPVVRRPRRPHSSPHTIPLGHTGRSRVLRTRGVGRSGYTYDIHPHSYTTRADVRGHTTRVFPPVYSRVLFLFLRLLWIDPTLVIRQGGWSVDQGDGGDELGPDLIGSTLTRRHRCRVRDSFETGKITYTGSREGGRVQEGS